MVEETPKTNLLVSDDYLSSSTESLAADIVLRHHIDLEPLDFWKKTPLDYAMEFGFHECTQILEKAIHLGLTTRLNSIKKVIRKHQRH